MNKIFDTIKGLTRRHWLTGLFALAFVGGMVISYRKQNQHEARLMLNRKVEASRVRDSVKTAMSRERIDSLAFYRDRLRTAQLENQLLTLQLLRQNEKNNLRLDSLNRLLPTRPRF